MRYALQSLCQTAFAVAFLIPGIAQAQMQSNDARLTPVAREEVSRSAVAIVGDIDRAKCSGIAIGDNAVLTAARCVIDLKTGKPLSDRQVIAGIDLDNNFMPTSRFFPTKFYIIDSDGPFAKANLADQPAIVLLRGNKTENRIFGNGSTPTGFHHTGVDPDPDRLQTIAYPDGKLSQMHGGGCAILAILGDGRMRLNCTMPETAAGAPLLSPNGIVGIYLSEGLGYYFGAPEVADLELIAKNYKPKHFNEVSNRNEPNFISMVLSTDCRGGVDYFLRYAALNDSSTKFRQTEGWVRSGEYEIVRMRSDNTIFYLAGKSGNKVWGRDRIFSGRKFSQIKVKRWGDYFYKFSCS